MKRLPNCSTKFNLWLVRTFLPVSLGSWNNLLRPKSQYVDISSLPEGAQAAWRTGMRSRDYVTYGSRERGVLEAPLLTYLRDGKLGRTWMRTAWKEKRKGSAK